MRPARRELPIRRRMPLMAAALALASIAFFSRDAAVAASEAGQALCLEAVAAVAALGVHPAVTLVGILALATVAPAAVAGARQLVATGRVMGFVRNMEAPVLPAPLDRLTVALGLTGRVRLVDTPGPLAFCFGWLRPEICLSRTLVEALTAAELEAVLRHEAWHLRQRDPLRVLLAHAAAAALFFLPLARDGLRAYLVRRELAADAAAVRELGSPRPLAAALYKALTSGRPPRQSAAVAGGFTAIDVRIDHLVDGSGATRFSGQTSPFRVVVSAVGTLAVATLLCLVLAAVHVPPVLQSCPAC